MIEASSNSRRREAFRARRSLFRKPSPQRIVERLVYLPGALVLIYGFWLTFTA
jgi:hypothetical protein